jgi:hypothetical protein
LPASTSQATKVVGQGQRTRDAAAKQKVQSEKEKAPDFSEALVNQKATLWLTAFQNGISSSSKLLLPAGADGAGARWP